ncbi:MAG: biotin carboxylase N-terminal domain-containing protein [Myxococcota bacterium]|nr:biotin carboxylase N-terminal domain-containing protein [Myxococcota bacterium]
MNLWYLQIVVNPDSLIWLKEAGSPEAISSQLVENVGPITAEYVRLFKRVAIIAQGEVVTQFLAAARLCSKVDYPIDVYLCHTEATKDSLSVRNAQYTILIPSRASSSSQMDAQELILKLKENKIDALWPGWGGEAENPEIVQLCESSGITFIGPSAASMRSVTTRTHVKEIAEKCGIQTVKGIDHSLVQLDEIKEAIMQLGLPVVIKAAKNGTGSPVSFIRNEDELDKRFEEVKSQLGGRPFPEKFLVEQLIPFTRHLEVPILVDRSRNSWALSSRDCSIQRRTRTILEETPTLSLSKQMHQEMGQAAQDIAKAVNYTNGGTAKFLVNSESNALYFMEFTPHLGATYNITEELFGMNLLLKQLEIAQGIDLSSPTAPEPHGHVVEVVLSAENPDQDFHPSLGKILEFEVPQNPGIRVDNRYQSGNSMIPELGPHIAIILAHGANRCDALTGLIKALEHASVDLDGGSTNQEMLSSIAQTLLDSNSLATTKWLKDFLEGNITNSYGLQS